MEFVAEGEKEPLELLIAQMHEVVGEGAEMRNAWQLPVGGYVDSFPVVTFDAAKMRAKIQLNGPEEDLDYITRHLQIEAVFNRGLALKKSRPAPERIELDVKGDAARLKSFVRWCYQGPPLKRPEVVKVDWRNI